MNYEIQTTAEFNHWAVKLKDKQAAMMIAQCLDRAINGNLGDVKNLGGGVSEMRIFAGQGFGCILRCAAKAGDFAVRRQ